MKLFNIVLAVSITAFTAQASFGQATDSGERKRVEITRTELSPELDGVLDDAIWENATRISDIHQYSPVDHGAPSARSEFYITYNENFFYLAARLYDDEPTEINARQLIQGSSLDSDDSFEFILDTFNNGRTGYQFEVNPNGIRREGVFDGPDSINTDWSGIWQVEARVDGEGWTAEVAIPFNTINFDPSIDEWGFSVSRTIARKNEDMAWSSFNRSVDPSTIGLIYGIHDIDQGLGLDIIPSINSSFSEDYNTNETDSTVDPSVDIFYKFTPNLTGALTINTDFSATEVDNRQVNLTRFSLFFPEKRDFFLQDVDIFGFGGLSGGSGFNPSGSNGIPFYSRRIGLSPDGQAVDINAGVKLTGRVGNWNVGTMVTQQDEYRYLDRSTQQFKQVDSQALFVGRAALNVLNESTVGAIFTQGDPTDSENDNSLAGLDFHYQKARFSDNHSLYSNFWLQQSDTDGLDGDDKAYGLNVDLDSSFNGFGGGFNYTYFGEDFNPALGFANRVGVETFGANTSGRYYLQDHAFIQRFFTFLRYDQTKKLDTGDLQSEAIFWRLMMDTNRGDRMGFGVNTETEGLERDFEIRPGIIIPAGEYEYTAFSIQADASSQRVFSPSFSYSQGDYFDGDRTQASFGTQWRPNEHLFLNFSYNYQNVELPQGDFISRLISMNANYAFTSKWSWINLVQYDNFSNTVGINSRVRWNPQAGEDLFLVINYNFDSAETLSELTSRNSQIVLKYTKTFRY